MLIGVNPAAPPELLYCLAMMGHGDEIVISDANFPSYKTAATTTYGSVIEMPNADAVMTAQVIGGLMPLDPPEFAKHSVMRMEIDNKPDTENEVHKAVFAALKALDKHDAGFGSIERQDFYKRAATTFAVVRTCEMRPYGCFILRKGVIF